MHFIGIVPGVPKGVRGSTCPGGHMGCRGCALAYMGQGHQPQEAHAPRRLGEGRVQRGEGTSEVPWGGWTPPPPLGRTPSLEEGARLRPPPLLRLYKGRGGRGGRTYKPWRLPPPCNTSSSFRSCLAKPCRSSSASTTTLSCCWIFINLSFPLAGSRRRRRHPLRTCVERGGAVHSALGHR